ncbi:MAG: hypothetical protein H0V01_04775 [Bacteroidetes bacterium]|nr:hypothetical protein [Bacteroidota bacterium]HET6245952.1 hypothetical protein [Bacteroidia bacterium]
MEIALCSYDPIKQKLFFSGANRSLIVVKKENEKNELSEIAMHEPFTNTNEYNMAYSM